MKFKKKLFPFLLVFALLLTAIGLVSANVSFSKPMTTSKSFNVNIANVDSTNIDVIGYDNTNITYILNLNEFIDEYIVFFDVYNQGDFDVTLSRIDGLELPDELKDIITIDKNINTNVYMDHIDSSYIKYNLKKDLTKEEKNILKKYKELKVSLLLNYNQA